MIGNRVIIISFLGQNMHIIILFSNNLSCSTKKPYIFLKKKKMPLYLQGIINTALGRQEINVKMLQSNDRTLMGSRQKSWLVFSKPKLTQIIKNALTKCQQILITDYNITCERKPLYIQRMSKLFVGKMEVLYCSRYCFECKKLFIEILNWLDNLTSSILDISRNACLFLKLQ